jgi:hypothetical protein
MASRQDVLWLQVVSALAQGSGGAGIEDAAADWFHERYFAWITKPKANARAGGRRPQDVWDSMGTDFLGKFREIGQQAAVGGGTIPMAQLMKAAQAVEQASDCPYCPDRA